MNRYSTRSAAKRIGISFMSLMRYIKAGKVPAPSSMQVGGSRVRMWTEEDVERVRQLLPKIANGRKTRWQRQREEEKKGAQPRAAVPHKKRGTKKKK